MHSFLVVGTRPGRSVPEHVASLCADPDPDDLAFVADTHTTWTDYDGRRIFAGWQVDTGSMGVGSHWHESQGDLTAFSGHLWPRGAGWSGPGTWAEQLARRLEQKPLLDSVDDFAGVYCAVSLSAAGAGCVASDPLGLGILYLAQSDDITAVSTRAALAARAATPPGRVPPVDPIGVGWLAYTGHNIVDDSTGYADVRALAPGSCVVMTEDGIEINRWSTTPWAFEDADRRDRDELVDLVAADIESSLRVAAAAPSTDPTLDLTGGKDSRLVLAGLLGLGVADQFTAQTYGSPSSPDALVAAELAGLVGLDHRMAAIGSDRRGFEADLRRHVHATSGMLSAWDMRWFPSAPPDLRLSGACGGILRTPYPQRGRAADDNSDLVARVERGQHMDQARLLRPEIRRHYRRRLAESLATPAGGTAQDRIDVFYLGTRLRRWFGTGQEVDRTARLFPLYSIPGVRAAFALGDEERRRERLHFELIDRWSPALARQPFAEDRWAPALGLAPEYTGAPVVADGAADVPPEITAAVRRDWVQRGRETAEVFRRILSGDPSHPVFEILDRRATRDALDHLPRLDRAARTQLYGALTAAVWLDLTDPLGA